ncbi:replicase polyprotein 1a [Elysia marginata]|uniref:Replicase polyprotein 1a n=1 Tax=Elysia marginata TaxID=1093978 RepID=A0AAV4FRY0_9GAST|nr:replicase polyprotein 1a [Elysia marginata]
MQFVDLVVAIVCAILVACEPSCSAASAEKLFDLHLLKTLRKPASGDRECKRLGYGGLAVLSSPEAYKYAMEFTAPNRSSETIMAVGLFLDSDSGTVRWADGTNSADDIPWKDPSPDTSGTHIQLGRKIGYIDLETTLDDDCDNDDDDGDNDDDDGDNDDDDDDDDNDDDDDDNYDNNDDDDDDDDTDNYDNDDGFFDYNDHDDDGDDDDDGSYDDDDDDDDDDNDDVDDNNQTHPHVGKKMPALC